MAGTRLWISAIILAELIILAVLSLYYGLCVQNDDILCHALDNDTRIRNNSNSPVSLRTLPRPSWWSTTLHIHLIVEESSQDLYRWSQLLEEWMKTSQVEDLPYFGQTQIHMNVVPKSSDRLWETNTTKIMVSSIWTYLPDRQSNVRSSDDHRKDLDWMIYVPASTKEDSKESAKANGNLHDASSSWSTWKRGSMQLVTVSTDSTSLEPDMTTLLPSWIGPWLETTLEDASGIPNGMSENDYLRQLQFTWHKIIMEDFDDWKRHLNPAERREVLLNLGSTSQSLSSRLESLLHIRAILEAALERKTNERLTPEFPLEHYAAVFLPLLFPLLMPFLTSFVKEVKRFKQKAKAKHKQAKGSTGKIMVAADDQVLKED